MEHLSEERLLELADSGGADGHLEYCRECRAAVEELRAAKAALAAAPLLELPPDGLRDLVAALPDRPGSRRLRGWPRALVVAAPVAVAAVALAVAGLSGDERPSQPVAVEMSAPAEAEDAAGGAAGATQLQAPPAKRSCPDPAGREPIASVQGPPDEVVGLLLAADLEAAQCGDGVEIFGADAEQARDLLRTRPPGDVAVRLAP
jgi:hypothetical protein